jgi:hypothetical protein
MHAAAKAQGIIERNPPGFDKVCSVRTAWAGLEFKVPSGATSALPPFRAGTSTTGPSAMDVWKQKAVQVAPKQSKPGWVYIMTPAELPPSRAETDAWLAAQQAALGSPGEHNPSDRAENPSAHAFGVDANTGKLLPGGHARAGSQDSGASDLLETPALCSGPSQTWRGPGPSRLRMPSQQPADAADDEACYLPAACFAKRGIFRCCRYESH